MNTHLNNEEQGCKTDPTTEKVLAGREGLIEGKGG
jgi:hypothetical protein